jgi:hypothetical protein
VGSAIDESLSRFPKFIAKRNFDGLESTYANQAREWSGRSLARKIGEVDLETYQARLALGLAEAERSAEKHGAQAIYFEFDVNSGWDGRFFVCGAYAPPSAGDESWAEEWIEELEGPGIREFGGLLEEFGFERTDQAKGCTLYMIARTVASLGRCADPRSSARAALCIGYRGQTPLLRIRERR